MPIKASQTKTFEQMLEEELAKEAAAKGVKRGSPLKQVSAKKFLKRKESVLEQSAKKLESTSKKSYRYYCDALAASVKKQTPLKGDDTKRAHEPITIDKEATKLGHSKSALINFSDRKS